MEFQKTLRKSVSIDGIGLHSGKKVTVTLIPARVGTGVVFVRSDIKDSPMIRARFDHVVDSRNATTLGVKAGDKMISVSTVEHLMAALQIMAVDNVIVEVSGPEVPILDGSSAPFCEALVEAGIQKQIGRKAQLVIRKKVELKLGEKWAVVEPSSDLEIHGSIEWDHPEIGYQEFVFKKDVTQPDEIAHARTFGFLKDVEAMQKMGLARGGSLDNAIVLDETSVLNPDGLRYVDEFVRHKVLDALGDFKLSGLEITGRFRLHRAGHELHTQLLRAIFSNPTNFEIVQPETDDMEKDVITPELLTALA